MKLLITVAFFVVEILLAVYVGYGLTQALYKLGVSWSISRLVGVPVGLFVTFVFTAKLRRMMAKRRKNQGR